jgi:hypothetical protein
MRKGSNIHVRRLLQLLDLLETRKDTTKNGFNKESNSRWRMGIKAFRMGKSLISDGGK